MKRLEDLEDSPLVPSLLIKVHEEGDKKLMDVSGLRIMCGFLSTYELNDESNSISSPPSTRIV